MRRYLNLIDYYHFLNIIFRSVHPVIFVLAICSFKCNWKKYLSNPLLRLLTIYLIFGFALLYIKYFNQGFMSDRYFLFLIIIITIFSAYGFFDVSHYLYSKYIKNKDRISYKLFLILFALLIFVVLISKALIPHFDKPWLQDLQVLVKNTNSSLRPVVLTNRMDIRLGYYTNGELYKISIPTLLLSEDYISEKWNTQFGNKEISFSNKTKNFYSELKKFKGDVFLFIEGYSQEDLVNIFKANGLEFKFKRVASYIGRRGHHVNVFIFTG